MLQSHGRTRGLVYGAYGEGSADVHALIAKAAEARAAILWREAGARTETEMRAFLIGQMRRRVGVAAVQAMARHRIARVPYVGASHAVVQATQDQRRLRQPFHTRGRTGPKQKVSCPKRQAEQLLSVVHRLSTGMAAPSHDEADDAYYLEPVTLDDDDDEEYAYEEVEVDDEDQDESGAEADDEDLKQAIETLRHKEEGGAPAVKEEAPPRAAVTRRPEVLDDFIRNVLLKLGMNETLDMFQREWCVLQRPRLQPALGLLRRGVERRDA